MEIPVPERWEEARGQLLPVLRRATEPAHAWAAEQRDPANRMVRRAFAPHLREMVVLDLPDLRMFVNQGHLDQWEVGANEALEAAHRNLAGAATDGLTRRPSWGLWQLAAGDGYESSRLALGGWLKAFAPTFRGRPVAAVPVQRALLIGDSGEPESIELLYELAQRAFREGANPLSPVLYTVRDDGAVVQFSDPVHADRARFAERLLATFEYSEQAEQLAAVIEETIAPIALHRSGADCHTVARVDALPALLPRADQVEIDGQQVPFERLADRLEPTELDPPRYRLRDRTAR